MYLFSRGAGYPVLFIHGMPTSGQLWTRIIEKLRGQFTCFAVDLPGLGRSPQIPYGPKQLEALADRIEQERVDHLALLSPAVFPELKPFHLFRVLRTPILGELLAPVVSAIFWRIAMRYALEEQRPELRGVVRDFRAPFSGLWGAWRLMSVLGW